MNGKDFLKLIGGDAKDTEYLPVACLLNVGHAVAGYYNAAVNEELRDSVLLLNARMTSFHQHSQPDRPWIADFADFIEEVVQSSADQSAPVEFTRDNRFVGKSIPLVAIPLDQVAVVYPVAHIATLVTQAQAHANAHAREQVPEGQDQEHQKQKRAEVPSFFDFDNKSLVLRLLRTKLW